MTTMSHYQELDELAEDRSSEVGILKAMSTVLIPELEPWWHIHPHLSTTDIVKGMLIRSDQSHTKSFQMQSMQQTLHTEGLSPVDSCFMFS
ncbi:hypothetical protein AALO_G00126400 [Alosa alosa]|uniref:Uncharacterized protein n=1 Tax=Alosa alosa TaxID=278164 RepID=A0AAV6GLH7_9TELE|nr:hypothetical protein AALO_G00126400 [Alosa alosa]